MNQYFYHFKDIYSVFFPERFMVYWAKLFGFCSVAIFVTCSKYFVWHILFYEAIFTSVFRELTWFSFSVSSVVTWTGLKKHTVTYLVLEVYLRPVSNTYCLKGGVVYPNRRNIRWIFVVGFCQMELILFSSRPFEACVVSTLRPVILLSVTIFVLTIIFL